MQRHKALLATMVSSWAGWEKFREAENRFQAEGQSNLVHIHRRSRQRGQDSRRSRSCASRGDRVAREGALSI